MFGLTWESFGYLLLVVALWLVSAYAASLISEFKGYGRAAGVKAGLVLGVLGWLIYACLPPNPRPAVVNAALTELGECPHCKSTVRVFEGVCTKCGTLIPSDRAH
jgi:hypothetical protein